MMHVQYDQDKGGHADGQAEDVDEGGDFVPPEDAKGDDEKTAQHDWKSLSL